MFPTDTKNPDHYHKVVDCQWACPAHTPVPEYIRLISKGRYGDAYMVNWESNVFPGVLGRVCDRPCETACRRGRVEEQPVAICRLKRVAADNKGDIGDRFPKAPEEKNGKKVALIGAGPASLTVARDLLLEGYEVSVFERGDRFPKAPEEKNGKKVALIGAGPASLTVARDLLLEGYEVSVFERGQQLGGMMRSDIPSFRLPQTVLDEEIETILNLGVDLHSGVEITSLKEFMTRDFDAVFVGTGAP